MRVCVCVCVDVRVFVCVVVPDHGRETTLLRNDEAQAQTTEEEKEEGPQRTHQARVGLRPVLQRHAGRHQGTEPQRHLWRRVQDSGLHVGRTGRGAEAGSHVKPNGGHWAMLTQWPSWLQTLSV